MRINKKKIIAFLLVFSFALWSGIQVFANNGGAGGGTSNSGYGGCTWDYCYNGNGGGHGVRLSLYEYKNGKVTYYNSVDFCVGNSCYDGTTAYTTSEMAGRIAYQFAGVNLKFGVSKKVHANTSERFACYNGRGCKDYLDGTFKDIVSLFKLGSYANYSEVQNAIYSVFGKWIDNLDYTYITIEPTIMYYNSKTKEKYYGTSYEFIAANVNTGDGMTRVVKKDSPNAIATTSVFGAKDNNCFVKAGTCSNGLVSLVKFVGNRDVIINSVTGSERGGYGISVLWIGSPDNVPPKNNTCLATCSGKSGDSLLSCAENYCQASSGDSAGKKSCIATCGYSDPGFSSCNANQSSSGVSTECDADTSSSLSTCTKANTSNYYRSNCSESSTISYGNSLPTTLTPGTGFTYTPVLSGEKTCQMTFELAKWKFDYASSYTEAERTKLKEILKNFQSIESNSIWVKDLDNKYKYDSSNATITIDITNSNDTNASNRKTTKQLVPSKTINLLNNDVVVTAGGSNRVPLYSNGQVTYQSIYGLIKTTSKNKTAYKLPAVCISAGTGKMYDVNANGKCDTENDGPYHEYYTDLKIKKDTYKTEVTVNKGSSNLNATNTCRYVVESPVSCSIVEREDKYELLIENKNNVGITYGLSTRGYILNGNTIYSPISENIRLFGAIAIDNSIVATCKYQRGNPSDEENTCTRLYKAAEYDKIRDYCRTNWISDTANYGSERECFDSCSSGNNSCKHNPNFSSSDEKAVINYCKIESNYLKDGYNSVASCVNDCLSAKKDNDCLGITCDYIYRPISLRDPFPNNRRPGYNWFGKEIYITDDLLNPILDSTAQPEYVVELNQDRINEIKKNTKEYNSIKNKNAYIDYVRVNEYNLNGKYESMFIHSNDTSVGGFRSYFTVVETIPQ